MLLAHPTVEAAASRPDLEKAHPPDASTADSLPCPWECGDSPVPKTPIKIPPRQADATYRLTAPRPGNSLRKGVKRCKVGSTILKHRPSRDEGLPQTPGAGVDSSRPLRQQPCAYAASRPLLKPLLKQRCINAAWRVARRPMWGAKAKNGFSMPVSKPSSRYPLTSDVQNLPGTQPRVARHKPVESEQPAQSDAHDLVRFAHRTPWADMMDSSEDEVADEDIEAPVSCQSLRSAEPLFASPVHKAGTSGASNFSRLLSYGHKHKRAKCYRRTSVIRGLGFNRTTDATRALKQGLGKSMSSAAKTGRDCSMSQRQCEASSSVVHDNLSESIDCSHHPRHLFQFHRSCSPNYAEDSSCLQEDRALSHEGYLGKSRGTYALRNPQVLKRSREAGEPRATLSATARQSQRRTRGRSPTPRILRFSPEPASRQGPAGFVTALSVRVDPQPVLAKTGAEDLDMQMPRCSSAPCSPEQSCGTVMVLQSSLTETALAVPQTLQQSAPVSCAQQVASNEHCLGGDLPAQNAQKSEENSEKGPSQASFEKSNSSEVVIGSSVPRKDHIVRDFDATKGYPGEGPPAALGARQPTTPPKALPKASGGRPVKLTSSTRRLGPPAKANPGVKTPPKPPPARSRAPRIPPKPPLVKSRGIASEPKPPSPGVSSVSGKRGSEVVVPIRVVRAKYDTGFNYEQARARSEDPLRGYPKATTLPEVRPAVPFNPASCIGRSVPKVVPERSKESEEGVAKAKLRYAKPTPKQKGPALDQLSRQNPEPAGPEVAFSLADSPEPEGLEVSSSLEDDPKAFPSSVGGPEPTGPKVTLPPVGSPKPAVFKVSSSQVGSPKLGGCKVASPRVGSSESATPKFSSPSLGGFEAASPEDPEVSGYGPEPDGLEGTNAPVKVSPVPEAPKDPQHSGIGFELTAVEESQGFGTSPEPGGSNVSLSPESSSEPAGPKVSSPPIDGPEPAGPKLSPPLVGNPEPAGPKFSPPLVGSPQPASLQSSQVLTTRLEPADPKDPPPLGSRPVPAVSDIHEEAQLLENRLGSSTLEVPRTTGPAPLSSLALGKDVLEPPRVGSRPYQVSIKIEADLEQGAEWRRLSFPGQAEMTARVHQTRRVLEALLLSWKPGSCLGHLTRVVSEGSVAIESRSPVTMRDRMGQLVVGSTIIASFVPDPDGPEVTVNQPVIRRLIACSQLSANACSRCDPISPSVWLRSVERPSDAFVMDLQMRLRVVPSGTLCRDILRGLDQQDHPLVVLCRSLDHWFPLPSQYKVGPGWVLLQWPVPSPAVASS